VATEPVAKPSAPARAGWPTVAPTGADEQSAQPQQPAPTATAAPTAGVSSGPIDAAAVRRVWSDVLDAVRVRKRTPHALLLNAQVTAVGDTSVTVSFNSAALARQFDQGVNCEILRDALREVLGVDWTVATAVTGAEPQLPSAPTGFAAGDSPAEEPAADDAPADGEPQRASARLSGEDAAMALLKSGLGAHVIGEVEQS
jgi:DNA polymerase-3 subunit gamma/tau